MTEAINTTNPSTHGGFADPRGAALHFLEHCLPGRPFPIGPTLDPMMASIAELMSYLGETAQNLIDLIDELEGDPDEEPSLGSCGSPAYRGIDAVDLEGDDADDEDNGDGEPSLGSIEVGTDTRIDWYGNPYWEQVGTDQTLWGWSGTDDLEGDNSDREPSLGWTEKEARGGGGNLFIGTRDLEHEHDGREPDEDNEPSSGAAENHPSSHWSGNGNAGNQSRWGQGNTDEREEDGDDREQDYDLVDPRDPIDQTELYQPPCPVSGHVIGPGRLKPFVFTGPDGKPYKLEPLP